MPVVGYLSQTGPDRFCEHRGCISPGAERGGLRRGADVVIEFRYAEGQSDRVPALASDLVGGAVNVFATTGSIGSVVKTKPMVPKTIPIVFAMGGDPVKPGIVAGTTGRQRHGRCLRPSDAWKADAGSDRRG